MAPTPKSGKKEKTPAVPDEKPKPDGKSPPKPVNEIEEIFQATKSKKRKEKPSEETEHCEPEKKVKKEEKGKKGNKKKEKKEKKSGSVRRGIDEGAEAKARRRRTNDGLAIYSAEELGFGNPNAGGTALCPFDCECCF